MAASMNTCLLGRLQCRRDATGWCVLPLWLRVTPRPGGQHLALPGLGGRLAAEGLDDRRRSRRAARDGHAVCQSPLGLAKLDGHEALTARTLANPSMRGWTRSRDPSYVRAVRAIRKTSG